MSSTRIEPAPSQLAHELDSTLMIIKYLHLKILLFAVNAKFFWWKHIHRQQPVVTYLHEIVKIFITLMLKFSIFDFEIAKNRSAAWGFGPKPPTASGGWWLLPKPCFFVLQSHSLIKKYSTPPMCLWMHLPNCVINFALCASIFVS